MHKKQYSLTSQGIEYWAGLHFPMVYIAANGLLPLSPVSASQLTVLSPVCPGDHYPDRANTPQLPGTRSDQREGGNTWWFSWPADGIRLFRYQSLLKLKQRQTQNCDEDEAHEAVKHTSWVVGDVEIFNFSGSCIYKHLNLLGAGLIFYSTFSLPRRRRRRIETFLICWTSLYIQSVRLVLSKTVKEYKCPNLHSVLLTFIISRASS